MQRSALDRRATRPTPSPFSFTTARLSLLGVLILLTIGCGGSRHRLEVGVVEDAAKSGNAEAELRRTAGSGFHAVALSSLWTRGQRAPAAAEGTALVPATTAAENAGVEPIVAVYQLSSQTPLTATDRGDFAAYT